MCVVNKKEPSSICDRVRESCAQWMDETGSKYVKIHSDALLSVTQKIQGQSQVVWDEEEWHYNPPTDIPDRMRNERIALYIFALDALNFCFWPSTGNYQYADLACTLTSIASADHTQLLLKRGSDEITPMFRIEDGESESSYLLSAAHLRDISLDEMQVLLISHHPTGKCPPDMDRRCTLWNELGRVLCEDHQGSALSLVESAEGSAEQLVQLIYDNFPGFRDCSADNQWYFLKRAQICVGDLQASLSLSFVDSHKLTSFADYRLPQLLRHWGVLEYVDDDLRCAVDERRELPADGEAERSIRAATIVTVGKLVQLLQKVDNHSASSSPDRWTDVLVDWYLWQVGERMDRAGELKPFHRVRTIYY